MVLFLSLELANALRMAQKELSIVIPVYNGASSIRALVHKTLQELQPLDVQIVLVNDGSKDDSAHECKKIVAETDANIVFIDLRRNSGEHNAVICGLNYVENTYTAIIDDDFQNPPKEILKLLAKAKEGDYDVVYSYYAQKKHSLWRNIGSKINGKVATWLLKKPNGLYLSSFKLIHKDLVDEIIKYKGPFPYIDGLIFRNTHPKAIGTQLVTHEKRGEGRSNYTLTRLISLYLNMFLNFSIKPIRVFTFFGLGLFLGGLLLSGIIIYEKIWVGNIPRGWALQTILTLVLSGIQFLFFGLLGEYLGKIVLTQNGFPQYVVRRVYKKGKE